MTARIVPRLASLYVATVFCIIKFNQKLILISSLHFLHFFFFDLQCGYGAVYMAFGTNEKTSTQGVVYA